MKNLMTVSAFNSRYFMGKIGVASGRHGRYDRLHAALNNFHTLTNVTYAPLLAALREITTVTTDILTGAKQPPAHRDAKRQVCVELAQQAGSELKWLQRKMHMGLT